MYAREHTGAESGIAVSPTNRLYYFHQQYIANTSYKAVVSDNAFYVASFTAKIANELKLTTPTTVISTRSLKHLYDKRTAQTYDFLIQNLHKIITEPDLALKVIHKRSGIALVKFFDEHTYYCSIETTLLYNYIVTAFVVDEKYLAKQKIIQDWRGGEALIATYCYAPQETLSDFQH